MVEISKNEEKQEEQNVPQCRGQTPQHVITVNGGCVSNAFHNVMVFPMIGSRALESTLNIYTERESPGVWGGG